MQRTSKIGQLRKGSTLSQSHQNVNKTTKKQTADKKLPKQYRNFNNIKQSWEASKTVKLAQNCIRSLITHNSGQKCSVTGSLVCLIFSTLSEHEKHEIELPQFVQWYNCRAIIFWKQHRNNSKIRRSTNLSKRLLLKILQISQCRRVYCSQNKNPLDSLKKMNRDNFESNDSGTQR